MVADSYIDLDFDFRADVPEHVLAAFSGLATTGARPEGTPPLPRPVVEVWSNWSMDWRWAGYAPGQGDPHPDEPWRHDWSAHFDRERRSLTWAAHQRWHLEGSTMMAGSPYEVIEVLAWLAPYVEAGESTVIGSVSYEEFDRPLELRVTAGRLELEPLGPDEFF